MCDMFYVIHFVYFVIIEGEREREKGALRPINANRLYTDE